MYGRTVRTSEGLRTFQLRYPLLPRRPWRIAISAAAAAVMSLLFLRALRPPLVAAFASSGGGRSTDSSGAPTKRRPPPLLPLTVTTGDGRPGAGRLPRSRKPMRRAGCAAQQRCWLNGEVKSEEDGEPIHTSADSS